MLNRILILCLAFSISVFAFAGTRTVHRSFVNGYPSEAVVRKAPGVTVRASAQPSALERVFENVMPPEKFDAAVGFFAPVANKYRPDYNRFMREYTVAKDKTSVVVRYLPMAEKALADAHRMPVPPKAEKKKAEYLRLLDVSFRSVRAFVRLQSHF